jgi:hypothetical protein
MAAMYPLTQEKLAANAYRTLGLSAAANEAGIEAAARRMRIWPDQQRIPPTAWDQSWIGPISRSRQQIEQALARLVEPASRLEERLSWYFGERPPVDPKATLEEFVPLNGGAAEPADRHDAALIALHAAWASDPDGADLQRWREVVRRFVELAASPACAAWLTAAERQGDFEKHASVEEIDKAVKALPGALAAALVLKAQAALDRDDLEGCTRIASLLGDVGRAQQIAAPLHGLLDRLEDGLSAHCREMDRELRDKLRTNHRAPGPFYADNLVAAQNAEALYDQKLRGTLPGLCMLARDDHDRLLRMRSGCAQVVALVALGYEWSGQFIKAEQLLVEALELAKGSAFAVAVQKDLERCRPLAERQRQEEQEARDNAHESNRRMNAMIQAAQIGVDVHRGIAEAHDRTARARRATPKRRTSDRWMSLTVTVVIAILFGIVRSLYFGAVNDNGHSRPREMPEAILKDLDHLRTVKPKTGDPFDSIFARPALPSTRSSTGPAEPSVESVGESSREH